MSRISNTYCSNTCIMFLFLYSGRSSPLNMDDSKLISFGQLLNLQRNGRNKVLHVYSPESELEDRHLLCKYTKYLNNYVDFRYHHKIFEKKKFLKYKQKPGNRHSNNENHCSTARLGLHKSSIAGNLANSAEIVSLPKKIPLIVSTSNV